MNSDEIKDSIAAYCLGVLDPEEKKIIAEQIASGDPEILRIYNEMMQVTSALPYEAPAKKTPRRLKTSILAAIEPENKPATQHVYLQKKTPLWNKLSMPFSVATVVALALIIMYSAILNSEIKTLRSQISIGQELMTKLRNQLAVQRQILNIVQFSELRIIKVAGTETSPTSKGKIYWDTEQNKAVFYAYDLPELPSDKDYQLWMIRSDYPDPVDAGIFTVDENGFGTITLDVISDSQNLSAFAVSVEPKGGMLQPTSALYLIGGVSGR